MTTQTYIEAKNSRAVTQIKGWLKNCSIPFTAGSDGADLCVTGKNGTPTQVQLRAEDSLPAPKSSIVLEAAVITGRKLQAAFDLFSAFIVRLGYEPRMPIDRGPVPEQKAHFSDAPELVAFRHTEFRRVANPSPEQLEKYAPIIKRSCYSFLRSYEDVCSDNMLEYGDLHTHAMVWTCNFIGLHELSNKAGDDNAKLLTNYLSQRFVELMRTLHKKGRNTFAHLDEAHIAQTGQTFEYAALRQLALKENEGGDRGGALFFTAVPAHDESVEVDEDYISRHNMLDTSTPAKRKVSAEKMLNDALEALGHDKMVEALTVASTNNRMDPTARQEAASRLRVHSASCPHCLAITVADDDEDEVTVA